MSPLSLKQVSKSVVEYRVKVYMVIDHKHRMEVARWVAMERSFKRHPREGDILDVYHLLCVCIIH